MNGPRTTSHKSIRMLGNKNPLRDALHVLQNLSGYYVHERDNPRQILVKFKCSSSSTIFVRSVFFFWFWLSDFFSLPSFLLQKTNREVVYFSHVEMMPGGCWWIGVVIVSLVANLISVADAVMDVTLVIDPFIEEYNDRTYLKCVTDEEVYDINFGPVLETQQESFYGLTSDQTVVGDVWPEGYRGAMFWFRQAAGDARVGAFYCDVTGRGGKERVTGVKMKPGASIQPVLLTATVSAGESLTLNMTSLAPADKIEWRKDGDILTGADALQLRLDDVRVEDSGIYESYYVTNGTEGGERARAEQGIMRLLVRACPVGLWGDECSMKCPTCFNGGVCHPRTGVCVCPPGFNGPICEKACGPNRYGKKCNLRCHLDFSGQSDPEDGCAHLTFCLPDPYGCSCAPGYFGLKCSEECPAGTFGAGCCLTCHCAGGVSCNRFTGQCPAECAPGYLGTNCQIECKAGTYGPQCEGQCNCHGGATCNIVDGSCPEGCPEGYMGPDCQAPADVNGCLSHPCLYGSTCHPIGQSRYYCRCTDGYISRDCDPNEIRPPPRPDPCTSRPCLNGGVCVSNGPDFSCVCADGYHGDVCQIVVRRPAPTDPPEAEPSYLLHRVAIPAVLSVLFGIVFVTVLRRCSDKTDFQVSPEESEDKVERFTTSDEDDEDEGFEFDDEGLGPSVENSFVIENHDLQKCVESGVEPVDVPPIVQQEKVQDIPPKNSLSERRWLAQIKKVTLKLRRHRSLERF
ncbi:uncharacterized protein LOC144885021 isoform X1 [Branchiostoma floridae x Branchiostoma japonicum]